MIKFGLEPEDGESPGGVGDSVQRPLGVGLEFEEMQDALDNARQAERMVLIDSKQKHVRRMNYHTLYDSKRLVGLYP